MNTVLMYPNAKRDIGYKTTVLVAELCHKRGMKVLCAAEPWDGMPYYIKPVRFDEGVLLCDMVICLGGDGTILSIAATAATANKPILGINLGGVGFMAEIEPSHLDNINTILDGNYVIDSRTMLDVSIEGDESFRTITALNDAVVSQSANAHAIGLDIYTGSHFITSFRGDGMIASTPTGSTAYSMSAGGPIVDPNSENMILTPICAHTFFSKSFVMAPDSIVYIQEKNNEYPVCLTCDGIRICELPKGARIKIRKSEKICMLIRLEGFNFYDIISKKISR